jgi:uncharacterized protein YdaU (DUF1376 family)
MSSPFFSFYGRDFLAATAGWTAAERGHYLTLLIVQWEQGSVPGDLERLELVSPGISKAWAVLEDKFPAGADGRRQNLRLEHERARAAERSEKASRSAARRWKDGQDGQDAGNAAMPTHMRSHMPTHMPTQCEGICSDDASITKTNAITISKEDIAHAAHASGPTGRKRRSNPPADGISWTSSGGWQGITDEHRQAWRAAYPAADVTVELAKAHEWLVTHPAKAKKSRWRAFIAGWLTRCQDRGGTHREPGRQAAPPPPRAWRDQYRPAPYRSPKALAGITPATQEVPNE